MAENNRIKTWRTKTLPYAVWALFFVIGMAVGGAIVYRNNNKIIERVMSSFVRIREKNSRYQFINHLLGYDFSGVEVKNFTEYQPLEKKIMSYISQHAADGSQIAVYFRDLVHGRWVGIHEDAQYHPASLMKVVIMIAYYKEAEQDASVLQKSLVYSKAVNDLTNEVEFDTPSVLHIGQSYTVEQLIESMITTSDNGAKTLLLNNIDPNSLNDVYSDLGLPNPANSADYTISAKEYSLFLRILYNATYLDDTHSEKALSLMSQATYQDGIIAGVGQGVVVAQKFGEHVNAENGVVQSVELHNCGIVYHKKYPYQLCVMTKGTNVAELASVIKGISGIIFTEVDSNYGSK